METNEVKKCPVRNSYFWTYDLYGPVHNAFDVGNSIRGQVGGGWVLEIKTFWVLLWNGIEPSGECHLGPKSRVELFAKDLFKTGSSFIKY